MSDEAKKLFHNRLDIHDRKQFELKLEYQPSGRDPRSEYRVEMFLFLPSSLNIDAENYPRQQFYSDIHNYVRLKTPVLEVDDILCAEGSPLVRLERLVERGPAAVAASQSDLVYQAKLLSCEFRGALRRFASGVDARCDELSPDPSAGARALEQRTRKMRDGTRRILERLRAFNEMITTMPGIEERTRASLRLVDEYMSLTVEQFFRKAVTDMDALPRTGLWVDLRKELMGEVIREESYRRARQLPSVLSTTGDNEEYMHRVGFLKKFCMNILFLRVRRDQSRQGFEEVLFALAAGIAMAFATAIAFWAQMRFAQVSLNFFLILVVGYMMKDRIKEGMRRIFSRVLSRYLFDRSTRITDPVTGERIGVCKEKVDYIRPDAVPPEIQALRQADDFVTVSQGELSEVLIRYQKEIVLDAGALPKMSSGSEGVTDIIRLNVQRFLRDMDEPEYALEYVDLEEFTIGRIRGAKSYQVDLACRFTFDDADDKGKQVELVRLVLDRNGIKRMIRFDRPTDASEPPPVPARSVA
ncbi:MAG: hypothetical protein IRZ16_08000 [Myxococcaceae bacterium]|nr:hypothetical protein [Myxococcaceae bacterium]